MSKLQEDLESWIYDWVSVYNNNLQAVPCPFAQQAYVDNKILIHEILPLGGYSVSELIYANLDHATQAWPEDKEVLVLGCRPELIGCDELASTVADCNQELLMPRGYVALEDHPDSPEVIAGEVMNQGSWALVLVQSSTKLDKASAMLERQGYYKTWSQDNLNEVVAWRKKS